MLCNRYPYTMNTLIDAVWCWSMQFEDPDEFPPCVFTCPIQLELRCAPLRKEWGVHASPLTINGSVEFKSG